MRSGLVEAFAVGGGVVNHFISALHQCLLLEECLLVLLRTLNHHLSVVILLPRIHLVHLDFGWVLTWRCSVVAYVVGLRLGPSFKAILARNRSLCRSSIYNLQLALGVAGVGLTLRYFLVALDGLEVGSRHGGSLLVELIHHLTHHHLVLGRLVVLLSARNQGSLHLLLAGLHCQSTRGPLLQILSVLGF